MALLMGDFAPPYKEMYDDVVIFSGQEDML